MSWQPPGDDGGSPITGYLVSRDGGDVTGYGAYSTTLPANATSFELEQLYPNSPYDVTVIAENAVGQGPPFTSRVDTLPPPQHSPAQRVTLAASPSAVQAGQPLLLSGTVSPAHNATVLIQQFVGGVWRTQTSRSGRPFQRAGDASDRDIRRPSGGAGIPRLQRRTSPRRWRRPSIPSRLVRRR